MKKILLLGSIVSPCPPSLQGGTERVSYYQGKHLAKRGMRVIFIGAKGTKKNFSLELKRECEQDKAKILKNIEFIEIGGGTAFGNQKDSYKIDLSKVEASRKLRIENVNLAKVIDVLISNKRDYDIVLNNIRGSAVFLPVLKTLGKTIVSVLHLNLFKELGGLYKKYKTKVIAISNHQKKNFKGLDFIATIFNPVNTKIYSFGPQAKDYALMISSIGMHKNQKDAILSCRKAGIKLILAGKIRDIDYFNKEIKPFVDGKNVVYYKEVGFREKLKLYRQAKVFLFPISWNEPFGLVMIEALSCGTPVIAYPNGGPKDVVKDGINGFLVKDYKEMAERIKKVDSIAREDCRKDAEARFSDEVIGAQYFEAVKSVM